MLVRGQKVSFNFAGQLEDGCEFANTWLLHEPAVAVIGDGSLLPVFEQALCTLSCGERCSITVPASDAYGEYDPTLVVTAPAANFANMEELPIGSYIEFSIAQGSARVRVLDVADGLVRLDCNHELAGHDLSFEIELVDDGKQQAIDQEGSTTGCGCNKLRESLVGHDACGCSHNHEYEREH